MALKAPSWRRSNLLGFLSDLFSLLLDKKRNAPAAAAWLLTSQRSKKSNSDITWRKFCVECVCVQPRIVQVPETRPQPVSCESSLSEAVLCVLCHISTLHNVNYHIDRSSEKLFGLSDCQEGVGLQQ